MYIKELVEEKVNSKLDELKSDEVRAEIVDRINKNVDIPFISEKTEAKAIAALLGVFLDVADKILKR